MSFTRLNKGFAAIFAITKGQINGFGDIVSSKSDFESIFAQIKLKIMFIIFKIT